MPCNFFAYFFSCIFPVIFPQDCEEPAIRKFVIIFLAVDKGKPPPIIFHNDFGMFTAFNQF